MQSELFPKRGRGWRARVAGSGPASCTGGPRGSAVRPRVESWARLLCTDPLSRGLRTR